MTSSLTSTAALGGADRLQLHHHGRLGNSTDFAYTDLGAGEFDNLDNVTVSGGDHTPIDITGGVSSLKDPIRITGLPNPTNDYSTLGFVVNNNMRLRIDLYTMSGQFVQELFDGNASEDVQYVLDIDANNLSEECIRSA